MRLKSELKNPIKFPNTMPLKITTGKENPQKLIIVDRVFEIKI